MATGYERFGVDILLSNGDFVAKSDGDILSTFDYERMNLDTSKFDGYYGMIVSLTNRLMTQKGDNVFHPEYGSNLPTILSNPNSPNLKSQIENEVSSTLLQDERISRVDKVVVEQIDNKINISVNVILEGSDKISQFIFPQFFIQ